MLNRAWPVIVLVVVALAAVALAAYAGVIGLPQPSATPQPTPSVTRPPTTPSLRPTPTTSPTPRISPTPIVTNVHAQGVVVPLRSVDLGVPVGGIVSAIYVKQGDPVTAGQLLLKLDQTTYLAQQDVAQATVQRARAAVDRATLQVQQLPTDAAPGQVDSAQADLRLALTELDLAQAQLAEAQAQLSQTELLSPIPGNVTAIDVTPGAQASAGQILITVADMSEWRIETTDVTELEVVRIAVGDRASITFPALPDVILSGRVDSIQIRGTTEDGAVKFAVSIEPDTHLVQLRWNMTADVSITPGG